MYRTAETRRRDRGGQKVQMQIIMNEEEFRQYLDYLDKKKIALAEHAQLRKAFRELAEAVYNAVDPDARKVIEPEALLRAVEQADKFRWL